MKMKSDSPILIALVVVLVIVVGIGLDLAANGLGQKASTTFKFFPSVVFRMVLPIILALIFLGLIWFLYRYLPQSRQAAYFYLIAGLIGILIYASIFLPVLPFLQSPVVRNFRMWFAELGFGSYQMISGFLLTLGIAGLIRREK